MLGHFLWEFFFFFSSNKIFMYWSHLKTRKVGQVKNNNYLSNVVGGPSGEHLCVRSCSVRKLVHSQSPTVLKSNARRSKTIGRPFFHRGIDAPHRSASWHSNKLSPPLLSAIEDFVGIVLHLYPTS